MRRPGAGQEGVALPAGLGRRNLRRQLKEGLVFFLANVTTIDPAGQARERIESFPELHIEPLPPHPCPGQVGLRLADRAVAVEIPAANKLLAGEPELRPARRRHEPAAAWDRRLLAGGSRGSQCQHNRGES